MRSIIIFLLFILQFGYSQTPKQTPTVKESVKEIEESVKTIGKLFKKKDKDQNQNAKENNEEIEQKTEVFKTTSKGNVNHIEGGKISENVVYLDADRFNNFNDGVAIIHKGNATAMINSQGQMIFPYNTYAFFPNANTYRFHNHEVHVLGIFPFDLRQKYMNSKGEQLKGKWTAMNTDSGMLGYAQDLYDRPKTIQGRYQYQHFYIDKSGKTYTFLNRSLSKINEGIGIYSKNVDGQWLFGYYKITGEKITDPIFNEGEAFSNGMALVGGKDEYGNLKYGYINDHGKLVIPFMFSQKPQPFSFGYAKVEPKDKNKFAYALINKKGDIVFSQTGMDKMKQGNYEFEPFQNYGLTTTTGGFYVMDSLFNIQTKADFFAGFGITGTSHFQKVEYEGKERVNTMLFSVGNDKNPKIYFSNNEMNHDGILRGKELRIGFINLKTKKVVLPAFSKIGYFDPVSGLAYAEVNTVAKSSNGFGNQIKTTKGYINEKGEWVILQKKDSTW